MSMMKRHGTCPPVGANIKKAPAKWLGFGERDELSIKLRLTTPHSN